MRLKSRDSAVSYFCVNEWGERKQPFSHQPYGSPLFSVFPGSSRGPTGHVSLFILVTLYLAKYPRVIFSILGGHGWLISIHFPTRRAPCERDQRPNERPHHGERTASWLGRLQASLAVPPHGVFCYLRVTWASCYESVQCIIFCKMLYIHFTGLFLNKSLSREGRELRGIQAQHPWLS